MVSAVASGDVVVLIVWVCGPRAVVSGWVVLAWDVGVHGSVRLRALWSSSSPMLLQLGLSFELFDLLPQQLDLVSILCGHVVRR